MAILQTKPQAVLNQSEVFDVTAVIVAAGSSSRMGKDKQLLPIAGVPCIMRSILAFERHPQIKSIIVVTKKEKILDIQKLCDNYEITKLTDIIEGGETRFLSVKNALPYVSGEYLLIHDGARPLVSKRIISEVIEAAASCGGAIPCLPVTDTVKTVDKSGYVIKTLDRAGLVGVQTPQGFVTEDYKAAAAENQNDQITDDAAVFESAGYRVKTVKGSRDNIKITVEEDILTAENIIKKTGEIL